ncbi:hypothetical protein FO488_04095 [Geobacter sp. FeAm09]|uniref:hypothetical protein n=1 Tax=Geobacter sp. FeAm09 TaxID=2597769 RepID=UPI0011EC420D|nr:hypothetical protein [Geobacter sp. FeAm09]QEM67406.1 hypothetical protein FO488_04095 [Geobacter sp. FeAm09]
MKTCCSSSNRLRTTGLDGIHNKTLIRDEGSDMGPSKLAKFFGYFIIWLFALVLIGGLFGAGGFALVILGTIIIGPIALIRAFNAKPYPKYEFDDSSIKVVNEEIEPEPMMATNERSIWAGDFNTSVTQRMFFED